MDNQRNLFKMMLLLALLSVGGYFGYHALGKIDPWVRADFWYSLGVHERAVIAYEQAIEQSPENPELAEAVYRIARSYQAMEDHESANAWYVAFVKDFPMHAKAGDARTQLAKYRAMGM